MGYNIVLSKYLKKVCQSGWRCKEILEDCKIIEFGFDFPSRYFNVNSSTTLAIPMNFIKQYKWRNKISFIKTCLAHSCGHQKEVKEFRVDCLHFYL